MKLKQKNNKTSLKSNKKQDSRQQDIEQSNRIYKKKDLNKTKTFHKKKKNERNKIQFQKQNVFNLKRSQKKNCLIFLKVFTSAFKKK